MPHDLKAALYLIAARKAVLRAARGYAGQGPLIPGEEFFCKLCKLRLLRSA